MAINLVHAVAIAEFEIKIGNTLTATYPSKFALKNYDYEMLGNLALPDGGHIHDEDWTYHVLHCEPEEVADCETVSAMPSQSSEGKKFLYGIGFFRNVKDASVKRGAVQKALLLLATQPYYKLFKPLMRAAMIQYMDHKDKNAMKLLYDTLNKPANKVTLFNQEFILNTPVLKEDQFDGASLVQLVSLFKEGTMLLWYAILFRVRVMICGPSAHQVGNACISAPLLVAPLRGFTEAITPYVSLTDLKPTMKPTYICGTTNLLFETKPDWFDCVGNLTGTVVMNNGFKVSSSDRQHIRNVLSGLDKGEHWVRCQFENFTQEFLTKVELDKMSSFHRRCFPDFKDSQMFQRYLRERETVTNKEGALEYFEKLNKDEMFDETRTKERTKLYYQLQQSLEDLNEIEKICDLDGVAVFTKSLNAESAQERKYAVNVLAQLALSIKGQISILTGSVLRRVIEMVSDPMPNVRNAAAYCILKISSLYIGVLTLVKHNIIPLLGQIISSDDENLVLKSRAAATLLQIHRFYPQAQKLDPYTIRGQLDTPDRQYTNILLELLDQWGIDLPDIIEPSPTTQGHVRALKSEDSDTRAQAMASIQASLVGDRFMVLELVQCGGVQLIVENAMASEASSNKLSQLSFAVLALVADSSVGSKALMQLDLVHMAVTALSAKDSLYLYSVARFLEVCCQHRELASVFLTSDGPTSVLRLFMKSVNQTPDYKICEPALGCLRYLYLTLQESRDQWTDQLSQLLGYIIPPAYRSKDASAHDNDLQTKLYHLLRVTGVLTHQGEQELEARIALEGVKIMSPTPSPVPTPGNSPGPWTLGTPAQHSLP
eukprot:GFYU01013230.1.p1 GENE.GFYU01013230.1~~GFYU01013230.1.p1  ORF type:complete len:828 (-),score=191.80 GFYU01013230.1:101-2584(-)